MMRSAIAGLLGLFLLSSQASAQLRTAPLPHIFESYNACFAATPQSGLDPKALESLGWNRATIEADGEKQETGLIIFGHAEYAPLIILSAESGSGICSVTAKLSDAGDYDQFLAAFGDALPEADKDGNITFRAQGHLVQLARTGSRSDPAMRAIILTPEAN
ncbi:MAG: hypothetical protein AAFX04_03425 [Pseudomonadota bacterium]